MCAVYKLFLAITQQLPILVKFCVEKQFFTEFRICYYKIHVKVISKQNAVVIIANW